MFCCLNFREIFTVDVQQGPSRRNKRSLKPDLTVKRGPRNEDKAKDDKKLKEKVEVKLERLNEDAINQNHRRLKSGDVACYVCNRKFKHPQQRDQHMQTHNHNLKGFSCSRCHKKFSNSYGVRRHMRMHNKGTEGKPTAFPYTNRCTLCFCSKLKILTSKLKYSQQLVAHFY